MSTQGNLRIGDTAPDFTAESSAGEFKLYDYLGDHWGVFFSHPADFTPGKIRKILFQQIVPFSILIVLDSVHH